MPHRCIQRRLPIFAVKLATLLLFPNCKINLGLQVRRKRPDGYHDLETVFYPVPVTDALECIQVAGKGEIHFSSSGRSVTARPEQNLCFKAYQLLRIRFPELPSVKLHLHKVLPSGAGLGGGSADGTFTLLLLNQKLQLGLDRGELIRIALQLGSDCPFFVDNRPSFASGRGEQLEPVPLSLKGFWMLLIHPAIAVPTADAFRSVVPNDQRPSLRAITALPVDAWRGQLHNDFEDSIFPQHPQIRSLKERLYDAGAVYAAMSGSGSAVYGLFRQEPDASGFRDPGYFVRTVLL